MDPSICVLSGAINLRLHLPFNFIRRKVSVKEKAQNLNFIQPKELSLDGIRRVLDGIRWNMLGTHEGK